MSNLVTNLCRPLAMSPVCKAVLMCLADRAADDGTSWPSQLAIREWTCLGKTAVITAVKWLEAEGILKVQRSMGRNNRLALDLASLESLNRSASRTSPPAEPVRQADHHQSASRTGVVREADRSSPPDGPNTPTHQTNIIETSKKTRASKLRKSPMPDDFGISESVRTWADERGFANLDAHLEHFRGYALASGKTYLDWDQAFMNAIRANWAKVKSNAQDSLEANNRRVVERSLARDGFGSRYSAAAAGVFEPPWRAEQRARTQQAAPGVAARNIAERRAATIAGLTDPGSIDVETRVVGDAPGRRPASSGFENFDYTEGLNNGTGT